jgi:hypothetical protein
MEVDVTEVFDPDFKFIYDVPSSAVVHLPPARLNITRLVLCRNYRPYDAQSCAMGGNCKFVHADCDYTKLEAHPIHVNYIWRHESLCTYPRLPAGEKLKVAQMDGQVVEMPSERILVTKGSQAYMIRLQSLRSGLASPAELKHTAALSHCAHYHLNRMCNRGERCNFIHAVHVDPNVQGDFKRAPRRGQRHPPDSAGKGAEGASGGNSRGGRGNARGRGGLAASSPGASYKATRLPSQTKALASASLQGNNITEDNAEWVMNVTGSGCCFGAASAERHHDPASSPAAPASSPTAHIQRGQTAGEYVNAAPPRSAGQSQPAGQAGRRVELHGPTPPSLQSTTTTPDDNTPACPRQQHQQQHQPQYHYREQGFSKESSSDAIHGGNAYPGTYAAFRQQSDCTATPVAQLYRSLTGYGGQMPGMQRSVSQDMQTQYSGAGSMFSPSQLMGPVPSHSESSYYTRSPQKHQRQQQCMPCQQLRLSPHPSASLNFPHYSSGSFNDSDALEASRMSSSGYAIGNNNGAAVAAAASTAAVSSHVVNVIQRTRRRREGAAQMPASSPHNSTQQQSPPMQRQSVSGVASFYDKSSSATSVQSPTAITSTGNSSMALRSPQGHAASSDSPYNASLSAPNAGNSASRIAAAVTAHADVREGAPATGGPQYRRQSAREASSHSSGGCGTGCTVHSRGASFAASPIVAARGRGGVLTPADETPPPSVQLPSATGISGGDLHGHPALRFPMGFSNEEEDVDGDGEAPSSASRTSQSNSRLPNMNMSIGGGSSSGTGMPLSHLLPTFRLEREDRTNSSSDVGGNSAAPESAMQQSRHNRFRHDPYIAGSAQHRYGNESRPQYLDDMM